LSHSGALLGEIALTSPLNFLGCKAKEEKAVAEVTATEDLMREHGVLQRLLLIFEDLKGKLQQGIKFPSEFLVDTACLINTFIQDYHEKLEEDYVFPRFEKAGKLVELVQVLRRQHEAGRKLIFFLQSPLEAMNPANRAKTLSHLRAIIRMYLPHAAREDTVLFPAFRYVVSPAEFLELGEKLEDQEKVRFGKGGFEKVVAQVAELEKGLGLENLSQFTP
jgi:hemerythrin-like domain-containing protein